MTRVTTPDCAVMCNLINTQTHALGGTMRVAESDYSARPRLRVYAQFYTQIHPDSLINPPPCEDQREWNRMTRITAPDCAVM